MKRKSKRIVRLMALRVLFVVVTLFLSTGSLMAQTTETVGNNSEPKQLLTPQGNDFYRHEVRLSGCFSPLYKNSFYRQFRDDLLTQHSLEHSEPVTESLIESIGWSAEYFYRLNKWLAIGCLGGQSRSKNDLFANYDIVDSLSVSGGNMRTDNWYVMPSVKLNWAIMGGIQCYSKAAIGIQRQRMLFLPSERSNNLPELNEQKWKFAWQVSALGVEIGTRFKFFAEIGYGWQGVFNMGFSYSWSRQKEN